MRTDYNLFSQYIIYKKSERKEVTMFPTELELEMHRQEMRRAADNQRLIQFVQEGNAQPTLLRRLRTRLSANSSEKEVVRSRGSVQQKPTEAIA